MKNVNKEVRGIIREIMDGNDEYVKRVISQKDNEIRSIINELLDDSDRYIENIVEMKEVEWRKRVKNVVEEYDQMIKSMEVEIQELRDQLDEKRLPNVQPITLKIAAAFYELQKNGEYNEEVLQKGYNQMVQNYIKHDDKDYYIMFAELYGYENGLEEVIRDYQMV